MPRSDGGERQGGPNDMFGAIVQRALDDIDRVRERIDVEFNVVESLDTEDPPTATVQESELASHLDFDRKPMYGDADEQLNDFLDSLWQLHHRVSTFGPDASEGEALALFGTHTMLLADWDELVDVLRSMRADDAGDTGGGSGESDVITDGGDADDNDDDGSGPIGSFIGYIKQKLTNLSQKILNLLSAATSLDSWELGGELSGNIPGFAKGGVSLTMTFTT